MGHFCVGGEYSEEYGEPRYDAQGIYLAKTCDKCEREHLSKYRPEILTGYTQLDVDEDIEPEWSDW